MSFYLNNEHIYNQLISNNNFENAMNIASFLNDNIIFSEGKDNDNIIWKNQWMKYCNIIMPYSKYKIKLYNPYKSSKFKHIVEYDILLNDDIKANGISSSEEEAIAQCYIKISQLDTFSDFVDNGLNALKPIINKIGSNIIYNDINDRRYYRVKYDLIKIINDKRLYRSFKLKLKLNNE